MRFIGYYGPVVLVATHVDLTRAVKTQSGEWVCSDAQMALEMVKKMLPHMPHLVDHAVVMDCNVPASHAFKQLKNMMHDMKHEKIQVKPLASKKI